MYNVHTGPCIQSSSFPVLQSSRFPDPVPVGVGVWSRSLETHSGESILRGVQGAPLRASSWIPTPQEAPPAPKFAYLASSWRSCAPSWRQDATTSPKISKKHHLGANIFQHSSENRPKTASRTLQRRPLSPKTTKSDGVLFVFTLRSFFESSRKK